MRTACLEKRFIFIAGSIIAGIQTLKHVYLIEIHSHWGGTNPHDHIVTVGNNIIRLKGDIYHYSFDSISDHLKTIDSFTEIGANELVRKNKTVSIISPLTHASWTFLKLYVIKRGFLDGFAGLIVSVLSYMHVFIKYSKAYIKYKLAKLK